MGHGPGDTQGHGRSLRPVSAHGDHPVDGIGIGTRLAGAGRRPEWTSDPRLGGGVVNVPVWRASTTLYANVADLAARPHDTHDQLFYGRRGTPTVWALADALTELEAGAAGTLLFPSGVAAIATALLAVLKPGDELLMVDSAYGPSRDLADGLLADHGITTHYYPPGIGGDIAGLFTPATRAVLLESPGSLTFEVQDVPAITAAARAHGAVTIIDNSWATPLFFPAIARGVDIAMASLSKYIGGHSDLIMGSLTVASALWPRLRAMAYHLGQAVSPDDCALALRGLRTLEVRMARHQSSGLAVADWLAAQPWTGKMLHPARPDCPGHALWVRDFLGASGLFAFSLPGASTAARAAFVDALRHFGIGYSWGGFESLALPVDPHRTVQPWGADGPLVRLSIGLEDPGDLIADLDRAAKLAGLG